LRGIEEPLLPSKALDGIKESILAWGMDQYHTKQEKPLGTIQVKSVEWV
jgi:hypothetical protein